MNDIYEKELDNWQRSMVLWRLRNFVPLIGLHLLSEGENTFGKDPSNDIVVNSPDAPAFMGVIFKDGQSISYRNTHEIEVTLNGKIVPEIEYTFDEDRNSERLKFNFIKWYIQYVEDDYFLRLMDETSPLVSSYEPYKYFPANGDFIFEARYKTYKKPKVIPLDNVIGTSQRYEHTGKAIFRYEGKKYELEVVGGSIIMFGDESNGDTTFPYGRYVRIKPNSEGWVILDFNYAFSPPRSVSLFTTCDLPPDQNHLPFSISAGEKYDGAGTDIIHPVH